MRASDKTQEQLIRELAELREELHKIRSREPIRGATVVQRRQMALFAQLNPAPVLRFDKHGVIQTANLAASRILGETARVGTPLECVLPVMANVDLERCFTEGQYLTVESQVGQQYFQFFVLGLPEYGVGHVYGADITERKHVEEELQRSESRYRTLIEASDDAIFAKDADGLYVTVNTEHARRLGLHKDDIVGKTPLDTFPGEVGVKIHSDDLKVIASGKALETENTVETPDGTRVFLVSKVPIKDEGGRVTGLLGISRDITDRKHAQEELERSNRELENFAYVASHDLQEPLRMVSSYVQLLARRYKDKLDDDANEFIDFALDGATRMHELINDLLVYSRAGTKRKPFEYADFNLILKNVVADLGPTIVETNAEIVYKDLPSLIADPTQLTQVFENLIGNAIKYRGNRTPVVRITAERLGDEWRFSVRDNGIGFEPQYAERIFGIFQRLHGRGEYPGTGIGLAICRKIVELHGGKIWAESKPGKGSTFYFTLSIIMHDVRESL